METKTDYKAAQKEARNRMCLQYSGPKNDSEKKAIVSETNNVIYGWDHKGIKKVGVRFGGKDYAINREPANKRERKKRLEGLAYRDKKGKIAKDEKPVVKNA